MAVIQSGDIKGCGHRILSGRVEVPGRCSEDFIRGQDVGQLQEFESLLLTLMLSPCCGREELWSTGGQV